MSSKQQKTPADGLLSGDPSVGFQGKIGKTLADSRPWWPPRNAAPAGSPNIIVILLDDLGFSDLGTFGAEFDTPNIDKLASGGVLFSNYTTVPMCTPARAAFLTGKDPHSVGCGWITHCDPGYPGYGGQIAPDAPTIAELLQKSGYSTMAIGKWHNTLEHNSCAAGDRSSWPTQRGFDRFYGFLASETSYFHPDCLYEGTQVMDIDTYPQDYFATDDWTNRAIRWVKEHLSSDPAKPFFTYLAYNAPHMPLQAKPQDLQKYRGRYEAGWDAIRERRFRKQIASGLFPDGTELPPRNPGIRAWAELTAEQRDLYALYMEVYAALVDNLDQNIGRLVDFLKEARVFDNTLIMLASDNGANSMGGETGTVNAWQKRLGSTEDADKIKSLIAEGKLGGPETYIAYPRGWAQVSNTPFRYFKRTPLNGGIRVPLIAHWPNAIKAPGSICNAWVHVTDVLPTLLDLLDVEYPSSFRGYRTRAIDGMSFADTLLDASVPTVRRSQHYELDGNRGFIRDEWKIVSLQPPNEKPDLDNWMLFKLDTDPTETTDVSKEHPDLVRALVEAFEQDADSHYVYPIDNRGYEKSLTVPPYRLASINRPHFFYAGAQTAERVSVSQLFADRSFRITARFDYRRGDQGVIYNIGGIFGGMLLYILDDAFHFVYQCWPKPVEIRKTMPQEGSVEVTLDYHALGKRRGRGSILLDGDMVSSRVPMSPTLGRLPGGGLDVGINRRQPASQRYASRGKFPYTGSIRWVQVVPGPQARGTMINMSEEAAQKLAAKSMAEREALKEPQQNPS